MPYAQIHYPFENKELLDNRQVYPADFIAEGVDQTRGWFFTNTLQIRIQMNIALYSLMIFYLRVTL